MPSLSNMLPVHNTGSDTIPPFAAMQIVGRGYSDQQPNPPSGSTDPSDLVAGVQRTQMIQAFLVQQPDADDLDDVVFNGPCPILPGGNGQASNYFPCPAAYAIDPDVDEGEYPAVGAIWGTRANQWELFQGNKGFTVIQDGADGVCTVKPMATGNWLTGDVFNAIVSITTGLLVNGKYAATAETRDTFAEAWTNGDPCWVLDLAGSTALPIDKYPALHARDARGHPIQETGGPFFLSIIDDNSGNALDDTASWRQVVGVIGPVPWVITTDYAAGNLVSHSGSNWFATANPAIGDEPGVSGNWLEVTLQDRGGYGDMESYDTGGYVQELLDLFVIRYDYPFWLQVTSHVAVGGRYPGQLMRMDPATNTFTIANPSIWVVSPNGIVPSPFQYYLATLTGNASDRTVWVADIDAAAAAGATGSGPAVELDFVLPATTPTVSYQKNIQSVTRIDGQTFEVNFNIAFQMNATTNRAQFTWGGGCGTTTDNQPAQLYEVSRSASRIRLAVLGGGSDPKWLSFLADGPINTEGGSDPKCPCTPGSIEVNFFGSLPLEFRDGVFYYVGTNWPASSSGYLIVPACITSIRVQCWGGGGGNAIPPWAGGELIFSGGSGGGAYAESTLAVTPGQKIFPLIHGFSNAGYTTDLQSATGTSLVKATGGLIGQFISFGIHPAGTGTLLGGTGGLASDCVGGIRFSGGGGGNTNWSFNATGSVAPTGSRATIGAGGGGAGPSGAGATGSSGAADVTVQSFATGGLGNGGGTAGHGGTGGYSSQSPGPITGAASTIGGYPNGGAGGCAGFFGEPAPSSPRMIISWDCSGSIPPYAPTVDQNLADMLIGATTITVTGTHFSLTPGSNTIAFNLGMTGHVTASSTTSLTVAIDTPPTSAGLITAVVTVGTLNSGTPIVVATVRPTVTVNAADLVSTSATITVGGTNFDTTPGHNTISLSSGTATVTSATSTSIVATFSVAPSTGALMAVVTTNGASSGDAVEVANITTPTSIAITPIGFSHIGAIATLTYSVTSTAGSTLVVRVSWWGGAGSEPSVTFDGVAIDLIASHPGFGTVGAAIYALGGISARTANLVITADPGVTAIASDALTITGLASNASDRVAGSSGAVTSAPSVACAPTAVADEASIVLFAMGQPAATGTWTWDSGYATDGQDIGFVSVGQLYHAGGSKVLSATGSQIVTITLTFTTSDYSAAIATFK